MLQGRQVVLGNQNCLALSQGPPCDVMGTPSMQEGAPHRCPHGRGHDARWVDAAWGKETVDWGTGGGKGRGAAGACDSYQTVSLGPRRRSRHAHQPFFCSVALVALPPARPVPVAAGLTVPVAYTRVNVRGRGPAAAPFPALATLASASTASHRRPHPMLAAAAPNVRPNALGLDSTRLELSAQLISQPI
eukprot:scaffold60078_cov32-Tisochrysis_lutea.AAC.1